MDSHQLQCMEVWGGNRSADRTVAVAGLDAWIYSRPFGGAEGGGDVYYVSSCATGRITRLLVADVAAHGNAVGDIARNLRSLMRRHVNQIDQSRFVQSMNQQFASLFGDGCFATALVTTFFAPTNHLSLCNAGHPPPLLYRATTKQWSFLDQRCAGGDEFVGAPVGLVDLVNYDQFDVQLKADDLVLCYTDSLTESRDADGEMLGLAGLLAIVQSIDVTDARSAIPQLMSAMRRRCGHDVCDDDLTLLLLRPNGSTSQVTLRDRVLAPVRMMKNLLGSLRGGDPMAWPEFSLANVGGALFGPLNRLWSRQRAPRVLAVAARDLLPDPMTRRISQERVRRSAVVDCVVEAIEARVAAEAASAATVEINSAA
ncbi:MAG: phosphoserine phosphatase RsbU/P [Humisphaera sp.]|nr:phosphoserine phosphatase RsbU/P [Humisphaera sp.]